MSVKLESAMAWKACGSNSGTLIGSHGSLLRVDLPTGVIRPVDWSISSKAPFNWIGDLHCEIFREES